MTGLETLVSSSLLEIEFNPRQREARQLKVRDAEHQRKQENILYFRKEITDSFKKKQMHLKRVGNDSNQHSEIKTIKIRTFIWKNNKLKFLAYTNFSRIFFFSFV